jgi:hypothetical protein
MAHTIHTFSVHIKLCIEHLEKFCYVYVENTLD